MGERDDVAAKRTACQAALTALREAMHAVDSVPQALLSRINSPHRCWPGSHACTTCVRPCPLGTCYWQCLAL